MGIMDEERRNAITLKGCIGAAKERVVFINTGSLNSRGMKPTASMEPPPWCARADMKKALWIGSCDTRNVDAGLDADFSRHGQIGKGLWAMPDLMAAILEQKITHPKAGADTA